MSGDSAAGAGASEGVDGPPPPPGPTREPSPTVDAVGKYRSPTSQVSCLLDEGATRMRCSTRRMAADEQYYTLRARGYPRIRDLRSIRGGRVVPYGERVRGRGFSCLSTESGFRCSNRDSRGMFLSEQTRYRF